MIKWLMNKESNKHISITDKVNRLEEFFKKNRELEIIKKCKRKDKRNSSIKEKDKRKEKDQDKQCRCNVNRSTS